MNTLSCCPTPEPRAVEANAPRQGGSLQVEPAMPSNGKVPNKGTGGVRQVEAV